MKIINYICCFNEIEYLPKNIMFYQQYGIDIFVADNYSTDGSWEWLNDNNINCIQFGEDGEFNLNRMQRMRKNYALAHREYDWVIYGDADEYIATKDDLLNVFNEANSSNCNTITMKNTDLYNTGEIRKEPTQTYFYGKAYSNNIKLRQSKVRAHKNVKDFSYGGDSVKIKSENRKNYFVKDGTVLNYGGTKTIENRELVYQRRKKAWDSKSVKRWIGTHYKKHKAKGWLWKKDELEDIRLSEDWSFIKTKVVNLNPSLVI